MNLKNLFVTYLRARFPYLYVPTWEEERILSIIKSVANEESLIKTKRKLFTWKITKGLCC